MTADQSRKGVSVDEALYPLVRRWNYLFADRERTTSSGLNALGSRARADLSSFGLDDTAWSDLAASEVIEVSIPYVSEDANYAGRLVPWEQLLSAATWSLRNRRIHVVRHLDCGRDAKLPPVQPASLLTIACAPGRLAERYAQEFEGECRLMESILASAIGPTTRLEDPSRGQLQEALAAQKPGVVHLACIDLLRGLSSFFPDMANVEATEGVFLADPQAEVDPVSAMDFGKLLESVSPSSPPVLVAFSTCYSAYRSAALAVAHGARLAIGFSGSVDGPLAEQFFSSFYKEWTERRWDVLAAFEVARVASLASPLGRSGQAVVLWSGSSLVEGRKPVSNIRTAAVRRRSATPSPEPTVTRAPAPTLATTEAEGPPAPCAVEANVEPLVALNYSLLHHRRGLFRRFQLRNLSRQPSLVQVEVELYTGGTRFPWRDSFDLGGLEPLDLAARIEVPLLAELLRRARESLRTTLFVEVKADAQTLYRRTFGIELLSADEWRDEEDAWKLLPSFVLPRDPAVAWLLGAAERYLKAIADDFNASFDGYQQAVGPDFTTVDQQVRAVWSALQHELPLTYINPPPTYTAASQRVRTPSRMAAERRGTCIDLALLLAACLEHIGVKPVLFLLRGHAFAGYWRDPEGHVDWTERNPDSAVAPVQKLPGCLEYVQKGALVPLETTRVTTRGSFAEACEQGVSNLADPDLFDAMIDVQIARTQQVLPLPLEPEAFAPPHP